MDISVRGCQKELITDIGIALGDFAEISGGKVLLWIGSFQEAGVIL